MSPGKRIFLNVAATHGCLLYALVIGLFCERWMLMAIMMIIAGLQKKFGIEFRREELIDVENVADLVALVEEKTNK